jgi:YD repeat-containing protein
MTPTKIAAILIVLAAGILGAFLVSARAVTYYYDYQNRLIEINFDDGTWMEYTYSFPHKESSLAISSLKSSGRGAFAKTGAPVTG